MSETPTTQNEPSFIQTKNKGIEEFERLLDAAGGSTALGRVLGITRQHVQTFRNRGCIGRFWSAQVARLDAANKLGFTKESLRPDITPMGWLRVQNRLDKSVIKRIDALNNAGFKFGDNVSEALGLDK